ncbi:MAG: hypothetical protein L3K19_04410 [Thermoplasmata archaeon]|nr:hypothetical protein [Thermoplasmata archaeon]
MVGFGNAGLVSVAVPWMAVVTIVLLVPGAIGTPGTHSAKVAPAAFTFHKWADLSSRAGVAPTARQAYGMTFDRTQGVTVLFGGNAANGSALGDTWEFVGGHWKNMNLTGSAAPAARWAEGLVYDGFLGGVLMFGGQSSYISYCGISCAFNDTWLFNSTGWHNLNLAVAPSPQPASGLVTDTHDGYDLLLSHPVGMPSYTEEWRFSGGKWINATATIKGAIPNLGFYSADDVTDGYVVMYGGDSGCSGAGITWMYRTGTFHNLTSKQTASPPAKAGSHAMTYDPRVHGVVMTGGYDASCKVSNQTWLFHLGHWQNVSAITGTLIPGRWDARMVWDSNLGLHGGDLTFSGNEAKVGGSNSFGSDTWKLTP